MFRTKVKLTNFYQKLIPVAEKAGYKIIITALIREADSTGFYRDVKRYWSSLHDVTGQDVLFVFAGRNAADELDEHGIAHGREPIAFYSEELAMTGNSKGYMRWGGYIRKHFYQELNSGTPTITGKENIAREQTLEIMELKRLIGISENQLPCLLFTILDPLNSTKNIHSYNNIVIPYNVISETTIYSFLKKLSENWETDLANINQLLSKKKEILNRYDYSSGSISKLIRSYKKINQIKKNLNHSTLKIIEELLKNCTRKNRKLEDKKKCFVLFNKIKDKFSYSDIIISELQRVIDLSFSHENISKTEDYISVAKLTKNKEEEISSIDSTIKKLVENLENKLKFTKVDTSSGNNKWDFFIAHSSKDNWEAERIYEKLSEIGNCFIDTRFILPGDKWTEKIRTAQGNSKCSIILITQNTPVAWYEESEYLYAINLVRNENHRVVPILLGKDSKLPYGLEQINAIKLDDYWDIEKYLEKFEEIIKK